MKVLVTGGAGFIGSHVADALLAAGHQVVILDNLYTGHRENVPPKATFYNADLRDADTMAHIFQSHPFDAICHQGALANVRDSMHNPVKYAEVNMIGTLHLLELARKHGCRKFVFASTGGAVYGEGHSPDGSKLPFTETTWPRPKDNYGASKLAMEFYIDLYKQNYELDYVILRYPNVYGPRQDAKGEAGVVAILAGAMLAGEPVKITGDGQQQRDFTFVKDVARANLLGLESDASGIFNIGTGVPTNINTVFEILADAAGYERAPNYIPRPLGEVLQTYLDATKARETLGWQPQVSLADGLRQTVEWMRRG
ncbi:MAG: NAD-dependent epimerase/dehydratase family protein [Caldilineaceae bacterium]